MKAALISINWQTEEVLHQLCKDELLAYGLLASIKDDFPTKEGWSHHVVGEEEDSLMWLLRKGVL